MLPDDLADAAADPGVRLTYLGQSTFQITTPESTSLLIDPWISGNPLCPVELPELEPPDLILVTHGHHDHLGDVRWLAQAGGPTVVAMVELGKWLAAHGVRRVQTMNIGGVLDLHQVRVAMTPAAHSSSVDEDPFAYVGPPVGFVVVFSTGLRIYHAGDTAAFAGMDLIRRVHRPHLALLPIGDHHTMMPEEAAVATELLGVERVVAMHYGVTPGSERAPEAFRHALANTDVDVLTLVPGETVACDGHGRVHREARR